jgi:predicted glycosyltransferase
MTARRVLFYVQHLLGVGHLARASRIALACRDAGLDVTLVTGGVPVPGFPPPGLAHEALPPLAAAAGFAGLVDADGTPATPALLAGRRDRLLGVFARLRPDVVVTEAFPFGRRQMRFELLPLLEAVAAAQPRPRLVCSLRDIVQERAKPGRDGETLALVQAHYDLVLVHGDPAFAALEASFPRAAEIAAQVRYTGLVAGPPAAPATPGYDVVVSAGGGRVGGRLAAAALAAAPLVPALRRWLVLTGPHLAADEAAALHAAAPPGVTVETFRRDFPAQLAAARVSVSQAGYNTVADLLQAGCRAVLVPYAEGGETEQATRAARLAARGRAAVLAEADLDAGSLAAALRAALAAPPPPRLPLATDGAARSAALLAAL